MLWNYVVMTKHDAWWEFESVNLTGKTHGKSTQMMPVTNAHYAYAKTNIMLRYFPHDKHLTMTFKVII